MAAVAHFSGDLILHALPAPQGSSRQLYRLLLPLAYHSTALGITVTVPAGFTSDLASIPPPATLYIDDDSAYLLKASVVHDWLYARAGVLPDGRRLTRRQVDRLLLEGMRAAGARRDQRWVVYAAVRLVGWVFWERHVARLPEQGLKSV